MEGAGTGEMQKRPSHLEKNKHNLLWVSPTLADFPLREGGPRSVRVAANLIFATREFKTGRSLPSLRRPPGLRAGVREGGGNPPQGNKQIKMCARFQQYASQPGQELAWKG